MDQHDTAKERRRLINLAQGGDGIVDPTIVELDPPEVANGITYRYKVVDPDHPRSAWVETLEQAEALVHIADLDV